MARFPFTVAEYFAGIGLFRMGLEAAGWRVLFANDWSPERARIYAGFFGEPYAVADVGSLRAADVPATTLATCSFPCVDLSLAGKMAGLNGRRSGAFWDFCRILREQGRRRPPLVLLENVPGWLSANQGRDFQAACRALNDLGYAVDALALDARCFTPQSRPRVFLLGTGAALRPGAARRRSADDFLPARSRRLLPLRLERLLRGGAGPVRWAPLRLPEPPPLRTRGFNAETLERLPADDPRWWSPAQTDRHLAMMSPAHLELVDRLAEGDAPAARTFYRRRRPAGQRAETRADDIAGCLRAAAGGSGAQFLVMAGRGCVRMRALTPREYARLQGVPDHYPIRATSDGSARRAFGDAVCVPAVSWLVENALNPLLAGA